MKFTRKQGGLSRVCTRFLFLPKTARNASGHWETRWLTFATWTESYTPSCGWEPNRWVD